MDNYEVFLLTDDDEFSLGTVREVLNREVRISLTVFADIISNLAFSPEDQMTQTFKIELRSPNGL